MWQSVIFYSLMLIVMSFSEKENRDVKMITAKNHACQNNSCNFRWILECNKSSFRTKLLIDKNVDVCRSYMVGVTSAFSYSREDRCVVTADVIILEGLDTKPNTLTHTHTHTHTLRDIF